MLATILTILLKLKPTDAPPPPQPHPLRLEIGSPQLERH